MSDSKRQRLSYSSSGKSTNESTLEDVMKESSPTNYATEEHHNDTFLEDNGELKEEKNFLDATEDNNDVDATTAMEQKLKSERSERTRAVQEKLQMILGDIKGATGTLLSEIDIYLKAVDSVTIDYTKCKESQVHEATRLEEVEPDVSGATGQFLGFLQQGNANVLLGNMLR